MKNIKNLLFFALSVLMLLPTSCVQEEPAGSKAIIPGEKEIELPVAATTQPFTIYADAEWEADVTDTWLSINPTSGFGTVEVLLTAEENPGTTSREAKIVIKGGPKIDPIEVVVTQKGDRFKNETAKKVSDVISLAAGSLAKLSESQVVAVAAEAFIVTDGTNMLLVQGKSADVKVGSKITLVGDVISVNGISAVKLDEVLSATEGTYTAAEPKDITNESSYAPGKVEYVKIEAIYTSAGKFQVNGTDVAVPFLPAVSLSSLSNHKLAVVAYAIGQIDGLTALHVTAAEDLGEVAIDGVVFEDNFEWIEPFATAVNAGDAVGTDAPTASAPNVFTMDGSADFLAAFAERGYKFLYGTLGSTEFVEGPNPDLKDSRVMYIQKNYLKFGKTKWNGAIVLPALSKLSAPTDVVVEFDWCWQVTEAYKPDLMTLQIDATVGTFADSGAGTTLELQSAQSTVEQDSHLAWQHVSVVLTGATAETVLTIRPTNADPSVQNSARNQNRWYLDNIKISNSAEAPAPRPETPLKAEWLFTADAMSAYADTFGGTAGTLDKEAGDGGMYVNANAAGTGKISYVQVDKTTLDADGKAKRIVGGSGHPYIVGGWPGDYWLFEATDGYAYPAGTKINISYLTRTSGTGMKYWRLEYMDGSEWKAALPTTKETINGTEAEYNLTMADDGSTNIAVDATVTLTAATKDVKFRMLCVANAQAKNGASLEKPNGGTCRIAGAEGTSPVIKVVE